jgi:dihydrofolate synthase/folylpolyglutamate synthase
VSRFHYTGDGQVIYIEQCGMEGRIPVVIDLLGEYQQKNVITALMTLHDIRYHAGVKVTEEKILPSLANAAKTTGLRGRWQKIREKPLTVCDTAHNAAGWMWIRRQIDKCTYRKLHIVLGVSGDKDISSMLELMPRDAVYYFTRASLPRALNETELMTAAAEYDLKGNTYTTVGEACEAALHEAAEDDMIYIGGSTFVVAEAI